MITCKEAVNRLWDYLDRRPEASSDPELEEHLGLCRHCCGELEFARQVRELLRKPGGATELPQETRARLESFLENLEGKR